MAATSFLKKSKWPPCCQANLRGESVLKEKPKCAIFKDFGEPETFRCDRCKQVFPKGWSDEDALAEMRERFPGMQASAFSVLCDSCNEKLEQMLPVIQNGV